MAALPTRLARLFTPEYVHRINAQLVHPAQSLVVKPNELHSALARPLNVARYEPERGGPYLAASLAFGLINGHPFMDGNKRTAFFLANMYLKLQGLPGLAECQLGAAGGTGIADAYISAACGKVDVEELGRMMS